MVAHGPIYLSCWCYNEMIMAPISVNYNVGEPGMMPLASSRPLLKKLSS